MLVCPHIMLLGWKCHFMTFGDIHDMTYYVMIYQYGYQTIRIDQDNRFMAFKIKVDTIFWTKRTKKISVFPLSISLFRFVNFKHKDLARKTMLDIFISHFHCHTISDKHQPVAEKILDILTHPSVSAINLILSYWINLCNLAKFRSNYEVIKSCLHVMRKSSLKKLWNFLKH